MPPTIHCIRHGQALHNISIVNHSIRDPDLTPLGEEQCHNLQTIFPAMPNVDLVVSSPLKRTLYTSLLAFDPILKAKRMQVLALPELQETSNLPCDTGSPIEDLQREFAGKPVDLSSVKPWWDSKRMQWAPTSTAIEKRARNARAWLMQRPESDVVVVTHGGFLQYLTAGSSSASVCGACNGTPSAPSGWGNAEWRSYTFSSSDPDSAYLVETAESKQRRMDVARLQR